MNYEQKYKEALERARVWRDKSGMPKDRQGVLDDIFPELKESEDERIRKEILDYLVSRGFSNEWIAWLEKQGEQKPVWNDEDEEIQHALISTVERLTNCPTKWYFWLKSLKDRVQPQQKQGEHKPAIDVPSKELIFSIWDLGNWWKEITKGHITEEYGTQIEYIQKHWHDSKWADHHLEKQDEMDNNNN